MPLPQGVEYPLRAVLDTNVLVDPYVRDTLLNLADDERFEAHWSDVICRPLNHGSIWLRW